MARGWNLNMETLLLALDCFISTYYLILVLIQKVSPEQNRNNNNLKTRLQGSQSIELFYVNLRYTYRYCTVEIWDGSYTYCLLSCLLPVVQTLIPPLSAPLYLPLYSLPLSLALYLPLFPPCLFLLALYLPLFGQFKNWPTRNPPKSWGGNCFKRQKWDTARGWILIGFRGGDPPPSPPPCRSMGTVYWDRFFFNQLLRLL